MDIDLTQHSAEEREMLENWMKEERRRERERRKKAKCPKEPPLILVQTGGVGEHVIRFAPSSSSRRDGLALGAAALELWRNVSPHHHANVYRTENELLGTFTRNPIRVPIAREDDGLRVRYIARWKGRGEDVYSEVAISESITMAAAPRRVSIEVGTRETSVK